MREREYRHVWRKDTRSFAIDVKRCNQILLYPYHKFRKEQEQETTLSDAPFLFISFVFIFFLESFFRVKA